MPALSFAVRDHRRLRLSAVMERARVSALVLSGADFFEFATNHAMTVQAWERPFLVIVLEQGPTVAIMPDISGTRLRAQQARGTVWLDKAVFYSEQPRQSGRRPLVFQLPELVAGILGDLGLSDARVGVEAMSGPIQKVHALLPDLKLVNLNAPLRQVRLVKHPEEIATMRAGAALSDWAMRRYAQEIRPGRLLQELDYTLAAEMCVEAARHVPGEDFQILRFMTLSGAASAAPHGDGAQTGARVLDNTVAVTICNVRLNGLSIENQRTFICGTPGQDVIRVVDTARRATEAGLAAAVEGAPLAGIDAAAQAVIEGAGYGDYLLHRTGHGIGVATHEFPEDMAFNPRPLLANEVLVVEPGIYIPEIGGARYVDVVAIGAEPKILTHASRTLESMRIA
jgi:Xaa-Pro aminopeptidase